MRIAVALVLLTACAARTPITPHSGLLIRGFEQLQFIPCETEGSIPASERWLPVAAMPGSAGFDSLFRQVGGADSVYVRVQGSVSKPGAVGHLGQLSRVLSVRRVDSVARAAPGNCFTRSR